MTPTDDHHLLAEMSEAVATRRPVVLATIVSTKRSVPRHAGTKMLVYEGAAQSGTIGGGELEARVIEDALAVLRSGKTRLETYALVDPDRGDPGVCGGEMTVYLEPYMPSHTVLVIGIGHMQQPGGRGRCRLSAAGRPEPGAMHSASYDEFVAFDKVKLSLCLMH